MAAPTIAAAAFIIVVALVHSILGEKAIIGRLQTLPATIDERFTRATLRFCWHALTLAWIVIAVALLMEPRAMRPFAIALLLATAILTLAIERRHLSWLVELIAAGLLAIDL